MVSFVLNFVELFVVYLVSVFVASSCKEPCNVLVICVVITFLKIVY